MTGETQPHAEVQIFIPCAPLTSEFHLLMIDSDLGISFFCFANVTSFIFTEEGQFILTWDFRGFLLSSADRVGLGPKVKEGIVVGGTWESSLQ